MAYEGEDHSFIKRAGRVAIGLVVVLTVGALVRGLSTEAINYSESSPENVERRLAQLVENNPEHGPYYALLRENYPNHYQDFINNVSNELRNGASEDELATFSYNFMRSFMEGQAANISNAPDEDILNLLGSEIAIAESLANHSAYLCAQFTMDGLADPNLLPTNVTPLISETATYRLKAAASGASSDINRPVASDGDWNLVFDQMLVEGATETGINHLINSTYSELSDEAKCELGLHFYRSLQNVPDAQGTRVYRTILRGE